MKNHFSFRHHLQTYEQTVKPIRNTALQITLTDPKSKLPDLALGPLSPYPQSFQKHTLIVNAQFRAQDDFDYIEVRIIKANSRTLVNLYQISTMDHLRDLRFNFWTYDDSTDPLLITFKYISEYPTSTVYKLNYIYLECPYTLNKKMSQENSLNKLITENYRNYKNTEMRLEIRPEKFISFEALPHLKKYFPNPIPWDFFGHIFIQIYLKANFEQNIQSLVKNVHAHVTKELPTQLGLDIPMGSRSLSILITELQMCYEHFQETEALFREVENRKHLLESKILRESTVTQSPEELRAEMARNRDRLYQKYRSALKQKYNELLKLKKESQDLPLDDQKKVGYILTCYQQRIIKDLDQFQEARTEARPEAKLRIPRQALDDCLKDYRIQMGKVEKAKGALDRQLMYVFQSWYLSLRMENMNPQWLEESSQGGIV